jgi:hypothetical protein
MADYTEIHDRQLSCNTRRRLVAAAALVGAVATPWSTSHADPGRSLTNGMACYVTPAADSQPFSPALQLSTMQTHDGNIEVLHRVECADHSVRYTWIGADDL